MKEVIYLIGSLRLPNVRELAADLRKEGYEVFDDWHSAGDKADEIWQTYEQERGHTYLEAIKGWHAKHVFQFDLTHLTRAEIGVLMLPAGKSAHLELGYMLGRGKRGYVLFDKEPERYDVMYQFATGLFMDKTALMKELKQPGLQRMPMITPENKLRNNRRWRTANLEKARAATRRWDEANPVQRRARSLKHYHAKRVRDKEAKQTRRAKLVALFTGDQQ